MRFVGGNRMRSAGDLISNARICPCNALRVRLRIFSCKRGDRRTQSRLRRFEGIMSKKRAAIHG